MHAILRPDSVRGRQNLTSINVKNENCDRNTTGTGQRLKEEFY